MSKILAFVCAGVLVACVSCQGDATKPVESEDVSAQQAPQPKKKVLEAMVGSVAGQVPQVPMERATQLMQGSINEIIGELREKIDNLDSRLRWMIWSLTGTYFLASLLYTLLTVFFTTYFVTRRIGIDRIGPEIAVLVQQRIGGEISRTTKEAVGSEIAALTERLTKLEEFLKR